MANHCAPWATSPDCVPGPPGAATDRAVAIASELLWRLTGRQFGVCPVTIRPCRRSCVTTYSPVIYAEWRDMPCGGCATTCACTEICEINLAGPVAAVTEVRVNGVVLSAGTVWRLDDGYRLTRVDGGCWPACQDLRLPATDPGTFAVTYQQGIPVPEGGKLAVSLFAREILKACSGSACQLPARVREITRQGMTMTVMGDVAELDQGLTGIPMVDMWIRSVNPDRQRGPAWVWTPDVPPFRTVP